jgi:hypothetical protein
MSPFNGHDIIPHVHAKTDDIITRYIPCVDFFVNCKQELHKGVKEMTHEYTSSNAFFEKYIGPLPAHFEQIYNGLMRLDHLTDAMLPNRLVKEAQDVYGVKRINRTVLGGLRENEPFGLRKWMSIHDGAPDICNDLEAILKAVVVMDRKEIAIKLAEVLRPIASESLDRVKKDVPTAYQKISTAHPHLPFFHRLEGCLMQLANWHPEEADVFFLDMNDKENRDPKHDVVCIEDSDDDE